MRGSVFESGKDLALPPTNNLVVFKDQFNQFVVIHIPIEHFKLPGVVAF
jgi:hypothetical protein